MAKEPKYTRTNYDPATITAVYAQLCAEGDDEGKERLKKLTAGKKEFAAGMTTSVSTPTAPATGGGTPTTQPPSSTPPTPPVTP